MIETHQFPLGQVNVFLSFLAQEKGVPRQSRLLFENHQPADVVQDTGQVEPFYTFLAAKLGNGPGRHAAGYTVPPEFFHVEQAVGDTPELINHQGGQSQIGELVGNC